MAYIEQEKLLERFEVLKENADTLRDKICLEGVLATIDAFPAADVEPIVYAHWDFVEREAFWIQNMQESLKTGKPTKTKLPVCSHCKTEFGKIVLRYKRCPECGAVMNREDKQ